MESSANYPFILHWVFGHQAKIPPINLSTQLEKKVFFVAGPVGVIYNWVTNAQDLLLGHKNDIISIAASPEKKFLVSVDSGSANMLIVWHAQTRKIFHVIHCLPLEGVVRMCFSSDGSQLLTLSGGKPQELAIWDWKSKKLVPDFIYRYSMEAEFQHYICVHPVYSAHFASCGVKTVHFFKRDQVEIQSALLDTTNLYDKKITNKIGNFTQTTYSLLSSLAVTATSRGTIIFWGRPLYSRVKPAPDSEEWFVMNPKQRVCIRILQAMESRCPILFLNATDKYIIAGTGRCEILYSDEDFAVQWSKKFDVGQISSISFTYKLKLGLKGAFKKILGKEIKESDSPFEENDFLICTMEGYVGYYSVASRELKQVLWGSNQLIKSVAVHPVWPFVYFGDYSGCLQKWNFKSKELVINETYESPCSQIELISIDDKGAYIACAMSNGNIVIFDAVCLSAKPCFTADDGQYKPLMIKFSPDSQHLLITDASSYVTQYRLQLLVALQVFQMMQRDKVPSEEPFWSFAGKTRQHQGRIVDCMFSNSEKDKNIMFYTLGEDHFLVQYNISSSKGMDIEVTKRVILERKPVPTCMTWYPLYNFTSLIAVLNDDGKMRVYNMETENIVRIVSLPLYDEPIKKIMLQTKFKFMMEEEFPNETNLMDETAEISISDVFQYLIFHCSHIIGLAKYPIDGNPNTSLGLTSTPSDINITVPNKEQTFLFTATSQDSWIFMYEVNISALLEAEKEDGDEIDAFKFLFPFNCDPDKMKNRLIHSVYALELEMKMLKFGKDEKPILNGEVPISFLEYVLAALGCFVSHSDLQMMLRDVEFESQFKHNGTKTTLSCLDIMKLYINYRPTEPVTKSKLQATFKDILALEEDPDKMPRARFIDILSTRGEVIPQNELAEILCCLNNVKSPAVLEEHLDDSNEDENFYNKEEETSVASATDDNSESMLKKLIPEFITEEVLFQNILCLESVEEDVTKYVLKEEDSKLVQEYPTLEDFVAAIEKQSA